ncbi:1-aminocyclopropane-1-carboxylate oxidase 1 [Rhynchospora pubera]|uniref:1-aminocyclopropane-1-carboxylate oxidase n=1 Tax=Rhynchospora pubera TaxID=906938 RepID=A0AAV8G2I6_9POAL|nr:1-aminocyclopropane-1-carboxylate oxidase 1 [Rhynchospora pubera]
MEIPVIDLKALDGDKRTEAMAQLHEACENWGFFWVKHHGIDESLMEKVKDFVNCHYEKHMEKSFFELDLAKELGPKANPSEVDWKSTYFLQHHPKCNIEDFPEIGAEFRETVEIYIHQLTKVAEKLAEGLSENLGLAKDHIKKTFSPPFIGTKIAKYPHCPDPERVFGLRAHTDAGGIILLLQDDTVPGLEFYKDGMWVPVTPNKDHKIFVNLGDQVEIMSNGIYKSILHRVRAEKEGCRLSIATFYNPGANAVIKPDAKLLYPGGYQFQEYLAYYQGTKFGDKAARFQAIKEMFSK